MTQPRPVPGSTPEDRERLMKALDAAARPVPPADPVPAPAPAACTTRPAISISTLDARAQIRQPAR